MRAKRSRTRGFTLVEMIVATLLLAIGVVGALVALASSTQSAYTADRVQTAALLGRRKLTEIELQPDQLTGGDQQGDFGTMYPEFRWRESIEATDFADLFKVTVTIEWGPGGAGAHQRQFATYLRNPQLTPQSQSAQNQTSGATTGSSPTGQ
jgi:prepilin-type N-terminal cleavage/methylation domain-containing protein